MNSMDNRKVTDDSGNMVMDNTVLVLVGSILDPGNTHDCILKNIFFLLRIRVERKINPSGLPKFFKNNLGIQIFLIAYDKDV